MARAKWSIPRVLIHPVAVLIGDVIVGPGCYVGPGASLRGDFGRLIQEPGSKHPGHCLMHGFPGKDCVTETDGLVGHGATLHGCRLGRNALVGMNAVIMDGAAVGEESRVAARMPNDCCRRSRPARHARGRRTRAGLSMHSASSFS
jgi:phenylacetic acid degradation protein